MRFRAIFLSVITADPSLGRLDYASLPQQALMELFIEGISNKKVITGSRDNPKDISEWKGLVFNESEEIIAIFWSCYKLEGSLELQWLPPTLKKFVVWGNSLSGSLDLTVLPATLTSFEAHSNAFSGSLDLTKLPKGLLRLEVNGSNNFSGSLDLTQLPPSMTGISLDGQKFEGETDFSQLPKGLKSITVSNTNLRGEIQARKGLKISVVNSGVRII